jgi:phage gpG-like protein
VQGLARAQALLGRAARRLNSEIEKQMRIAVLEVAGRAKFYVRGSRRTNAPDRLGVRTGRLRQSIGGVVQRRGLDTVGIVGPQSVKYAKIHEFGGTINHPKGYIIRIPRRPYLAPALADMRGRIHELLGAAFDGAIEAK